MSIPVYSWFRSLFPQCTACKSRLFLGLPHFCIDFSQFLSASLTSLRARCRGLKGWPKRRWPRVRTRVWSLGAAVAHWAALVWSPRRGLTQEENTVRQVSKFSPCKILHVCMSLYVFFIRTCALCSISIIIILHIYIYYTYIYMQN